MDIIKQQASGARWGRLAVKGAIAALTVVLAMDSVTPDLGWQEFAGQLGPYAVATILLAIINAMWRTDAPKG